MKQNTASIVVRLLEFTKPYRKYLIGAFLCALLSVAMTLYAPILIGHGIDTVIGPNQVDFTRLAGILVKLAAVVALSAVFQWLMSLCTNIITQSTVKDLRTAVFKKYETVPFSYIDRNPHGDLISRMVNDIDLISDGLIQGFSQLLTGLVTIGGTLLFMLSINVKIALVVVVLTPLSLFVAAFIAKRTFVHFQKQSAIRGELDGYIEEMIGNQRVVKAFGYESRSEARLNRINENLYHVGIHAQFYSSMTNPCTRFVNALVYASVGIAGAVSAISGGMTIGQLSSFLNYANQYTKPFNEITGVMTELQTAIASAARVFAVLDEPSEEPDSNHAMVLTDCAGEVVMRNVDFSYSKEKPLIRDLNVFAKKGQRIAVVGPTGCGKTTLINLLMRFYDIDRGTIQVDGIDTRDITRNSLRSMFGMVLQETWMFTGTVRDNIAYGKPDASMEEIIEAAKSAHAHSFIKRLPKGYDTVIGEEAGGISQGEKQLLCIARIMLTKPPMLILDEATSSIDTRTEVLIQEAFSKIMEGRTSFIVAHRLSTIKEADCILVMKDGNIIEQGRHEELLEQKGFYANLYNSQFVQVS